MPQAFDARGGAGLTQNPQLVRTRAGDHPAAAGGRAGYVATFA